MGFSLFFSFKGRINRLQYWLGSLGAGVVFFLALVMLLATSGMSIAAAGSEAGALQAFATFSAVLIPLSMVMGWVGLAIQTKRFHDRGRSGLFTLLPFIPTMMIMITLVTGVAAQTDPHALLASLDGWVKLLWLINFAFFIDLGCLPGQESPNKYGNPPVGGSTAPSSPTYTPPKPAAPMGAQASLASALGGAESAIDRAIAARARGIVAPAPAAATATTALAPRAASGASFGRKVTR